ncbi:MAG TPA: hypothetical protein VFR09_04130, partial [Alphaproteobacteria bacterium]|nr:hypothetical protein [Alphaproteobacteria bacterium]
HTDMLGVSTSIKGVNNETVRLPGLHVVTTVAGDGGTVGLSGIELKENNLWHMVDMRRPYAEFPPEYVHQVAVGDVAIWRSNHPHAAATMSRPESYRVMGAMSPFLTHAPRG